MKLERCQFNSQAPHPNISQYPRRNQVSSQRTNCTRIMALLAGSACSLHFFFFHSALRMCDLCVLFRWGGEETGGEGEGCRPGDLAWIGSNQRSDANAQPRGRHSCSKVTERFRVPCKVSSERMNCLLLPSSPTLFFFASKIILKKDGEMTHGNPDGQVPGTHTIRSICNVSEEHML